MPKNTNISTEPFNQNTTECEIRFVVSEPGRALGQSLRVYVQGRVTLDDGTLLSKNYDSMLSDTPAIDTVKRAALIELLRDIWRDYRKDVSDD